MSHECDDCGQEFETLTRLRLHDCSSMEESEGTTVDSSDTDNLTPSGGTDRRPETVELASLDAFLDDGADGEVDNLAEAMATYESELQSASESGASDRYSGIRNGYRRTLISELDEVTQAEGWTVLEELLGAYHPTTAEGFPHVTTILQNVTGRNFIRTRLADGVEAIPVVALEYFETIRTQVGEHQDFIIEGLHPYGWGTGHPEIAVAERIHEHASEHIFSTSPMLEHAFYADQYMAVDLLERIIHDETVQHEITYRLDETITGARWLLDAPAGAASDHFWPTIPRYWDWHDDLVFDFELEDAVEHRIRNLVREEGLENDLPQDWQITDLTL
jgi:predicted  nucleic acid-binding Zn-ribbon protein